MKYVEPILFPISPDPLEVLKYAGKNNLKKIDVYTNIQPYYLYYNLYYGYVDPDLQQNCITELSKWDYPVNNISIEDFVLFLKSMIKNSESVYSNYYYVFITKYLMENPQYEQNIGKFFEWLKKPNDYTFKKTFRINILETLENYKYNTIVFLNMWSDKQKNIIPWLNLLKGSNPRFFNQSALIEKSGMFLLEGGRVYIENKKDLGKVLFSLGDEFQLIGDNIIKQLSSKPKTTINEINWL